MPPEVIWHTSLPVGRHGCKTTCGLSGLKKPCLKENRCENSFYLGNASPKGQSLGAGPDILHSTWGNLLPSYFARPFPLCPPQTKRTLASIIHRMSFNTLRKFTGAPFVLRLNKPRSSSLSSQIFYNSLIMLIICHSQMNHFQSIYIPLKKFFFAPN